MSRAGNCLGQLGKLESFFSSLKTEQTARKVYRTRDEARADVFDYIERFYKPHAAPFQAGLSQPYGVRGSELCEPNPVSTKPAAGQFAFQTKASAPRKVTLLMK